MKSNESKISQEKGGEGPNNNYELVVNSWNIFLISGAVMWVSESDIL